MSAPAEGLPDPASWRDAFADLRDRLLSSPRFQAAASRLPLTRPIARRRARALFDLCAGFVYAQVLLACVRLRLFDLLAERPLTAAAAAPRLGLSPAAADRLLRAAAALRLARHRPGGRFGLGALGAALRGNPGVAAMVEHHALLYADLADPVALLRGEAPPTGLAAAWPYAARPVGVVSAGAPGAEAVAGYSALMAVTQPMIASAVLDAYPVRRHRRLLDVGGGEGVFVAAAARRAPRLALGLFDLPAVADRARARLAAGPAAGRVTVTGGDMFADPLPAGADLITLVRVVHDHDDAAALALLVAARRALAPGGTLLIAEPMAETGGAEPVGDAYFGFYLLAMGSGRPRSPAALADLLRRAGFGPPRARRTALPMLVQVLVARAGAMPPGGPPLSEAALTQGGGQT